MQTKGKKSLKNVSPTILSEIIKDLIEQYGGKAAVCRHLGYPKEKRKSEQVKLGQYETARQRPKAEFFELWKEVFGDDLLALERERNVSRGTKKQTNSTPVVGAALLKEKEPDEHVKLLRTNLQLANRVISEQDDKIKQLEEKLAHLQGKR